MPIQPPVSVQQPPSTSPALADTVGLQATETPQVAGIATTLAGVSPDQRLDSQHASSLGQPSGPSLGSHDTGNSPPGSVQTFASGQAAALRTQAAGHVRDHPVGPTEQLDPRKQAGPVY